MALSKYLHFDRARKRVYAVGFSNYKGYSQAIRSKKRYDYNSSECSDSFLDCPLAIDANTQMKKVLDECNAGLKSGNRFRQSKKLFSGVS
jgi:hypothetical protein